MLFLYPCLLLLQGTPQRSEALTVRPLFVDPHEFLLPADIAPARIVLGDVDGDGDLDALALETFGPFQPAFPRLWINHAGRFRRGPEFDAFYGFPEQAEFVDLDGDGDLDALIGGFLAVNVGSAGFVQDPLPEPQSLPHERTFADFNGNGVKDAAYVAGGVLTLLLNDGSGHLSDASSNLPAGLPATSFVSSGDVDGDLDADLLAGSVGATYLLLNLGNGSFISAPANLPPTVHGGFELADVDGDLDLDALAFGELWLNNGAGVFTDASGQLPGTSGAGGILFDVEGDGDSDLLAGQVLINDGGGTFALAPSFAPGLPTVGDLDGDGDADLVGGAVWGWDGFHAIPGSCTTFLGDGLGAFAAPGSVREEIEAPRLSADQALLADMDGDGALDAVVASAANTSPFSSYVVQTFLRLGDGHGRFGGATGAMDPIQGVAVALAAADLEDDGDMDLLVASRNDGDGSGGGIKRLIQGPPGVFTHPEGPGSHLPGNRALDVGDLDGDGDPDLILATLAAVPVPQGLALNDGSGSFVLQPTPFVLLGRAVRLFDLEGDGDLDALWLGDGAVLWRNEGTGWTDVSTQLSFSAGGSLDAGDVDLDGDVDLLVGDTSSLRLHKNNGSGVFTAGKLLVATVPNPNGIAIHGRFADLEGDGDLDVLSAESDPLVNDGSGRLKRGSWSGSVAASQALGDLDQDGDLDLLVPRVEDSVVRANQMRHVQWRNLPQLGRDLGLEVSGPRSQAFVLYSSSSTGSVFLAGQGWLLLGAPLTTVATGSLDGRGRAVVTTSVPNLPSLIGTTLYWQALVGNVPRFTNRDSTTVTGY